jgi:hypothetical protein
MILTGFLAFLFSLTIASCDQGKKIDSRVQVQPKMATQIPPEITTPDTVQTSIGTLWFIDGLPDKATVAKLYDNLDLMRGVDVFLNSIAAASMRSHITGRNL